MINENQLAEELKNKTIRFSPELEELFNDDYHARSLAIIRYGLGIGLILCSAPVILDLLLTTSAGSGLWIFIRLATVCAVFISSFVMTFSRFFKKIMQPALCLLVIAACLVIMSIPAAPDKKPAACYYFTGLLTVMIWAYTLLRIKFIYATATCWLAVLLYNMTLVVFTDSFMPAAGSWKFLTDNVMLISVNILGMFAAYLMEFYPRTDFLHRMLIENNSRRTEAERDELSLKNSILHNELQMARKIQQKLIPSSSPSPDIYALYKPMEELGGDLYDFIRFRENRNIGIFVSDVSGHGVPASLVTSMIKSIITNSQKLKYDPSKLLAHLNKMLVNMTADNFITAFYGIYNPDTRKLVYSNAGHNPPIVIFNDRSTMLDYEKGKSIPLAIADEEELALIREPFTNITVRLPENSKLILYTDGLMEACSPARGQKQYFGDIAEKTFIELKNLPCREFVPAVYERLKEFRQGESFNDDICIICVDIK